jgi:hypothetical protein
VVLKLERHYAFSHSGFVGGAMRLSIPPIDTVPVKLRCRTLAVRAFDANGVMVGEKLVDGKKLLATAILSLFAEPHAAYLHVYYATDDCYAARVDRFPIPQPPRPHQPNKDRQLHFAGNAVVILPARAGARLAILTIRGALYERARAPRLAILRHRMAG